eukprot:TRINITY_DN9138_c0_g1_i1.p1 TRINITY_DN9138_c0_g1~~TRINITY_DN9138_c0_g1_i1.p1  ORF type:complete len:464 (+),score=94.74 TRINITY_DN9138_c0_g1_i1:73-1464(+)
MTEQKLADAFAAVAQAREAKPAAFQDKAKEALELLRRALPQAAKDNVGLLDNAQKSEDMTNTLEFLHMAYKPVRAKQILECFKILLDRPKWQYAASANEDVKAKTLQLLREKAADMADICDLIEAGPEKPIEDAIPAAKDVDDKPKKIESAAEREKRLVGEDLTRQLLQEGIAIMREVAFEFPTGADKINESDRAFAGFNSFVKGVSRLDSAFTSKGKDLHSYEAFIQAIPDKDIPGILEFLVQVHENRITLMAQAKYAVDKFGLVSPRFQAAVDQRSAATDETRLPWLSAPPPPTATAGGYADVPGGAKTIVDRGPPVKSSLRDDAVLEVVWLDRKQKAFDPSSSHIQELRTNGIQVTGFQHDGEETDAEDFKALTYVLSSITDPSKHLVAMVVNNKDLHKQMLKDVNRHCDKEGKAHPFHVACTAHGTAEDFEGCDIAFLNKDWVQCQKAILQEVIERMGK